MDAEGTEPTLKPQLPRGKQFNRISTAAQAHTEMPFETLLSLRLKIIIYRHLLKVHSYNTCQINREPRKNNVCLRMLLAIQSTLMSTQPPMQRRHLCCVDGRSYADLPNIHST